MTRPHSRRAAGLATLIAIAATAPGAHALGGDADTGAIVINGLTIRKLQDLDFGVIAPSATQPGTVLVRRGANYSSACSPELTCLAPGNRARFSVFGWPFLVYTISGPQSVTLNGPNGATMIATGFVGAGSGNDTAWRGYQVINKNGKQIFNIGAVLTVNPNQPAGTYTGSFTITVDYQ